VTTLITAAKETIKKSEVFENGFKSGPFWKRIVMKTLCSISSVDIGEKRRLLKKETEITFHTIVYCIYSENFRQ